MGLPVLTMKGFNANSRCGESILKNVELENLIATDDDDYYKKAISFLSLAIKQQDREAQFVLGQMRMRGEGGDVNLEDAVLNFREAANNGHMLAQFTLAEMLHRGNLIKKDIGVFNTFHIFNDNLLWFDALFDKAIKSWSSW